MGKTNQVDADADSAVSEARASAEEHAQRALDEALRESFPASDPIAVSIDSAVVAHNPTERKR